MRLVSSNGVTGYTAVVQFGLQCLSQKQDEVYNLLSSKCEISTLKCNIPVRTQHSVTRFCTFDSGPSCEPFSRTYLRIIEQGSMIKLSVPTEKEMGHQHFASLD